MPQTQIRDCQSVRVWQRRCCTKVHQLPVVHELPAVHELLVVRRLLPTVRQLPAVHCAVIL